MNRVPSKSSPKSSSKSAPRSSRASPTTDRRVTKLLAWYDANRRDLPWRVNGQPTHPQPYHVLVSEAMLQQTQVATVIAYFERFIEAFPTLQALADADEQTVLRQWQGLGYYRRARNLHAAARMIVERFDGQIPDDVATLRELPGVGRYTAGAIASIAFGKSEPLVDGNVARVLARWDAYDQPVDATAGQKHIWAMAEKIVPPNRPGDFNQALMELGATLCLAKSPQCLMCPMATGDDCAALKHDDPQRFPVTQPRRDPKSVTHHIVAVNRRGKWLFTQRPAVGLWSNMWQMPTTEDLPVKTDDAQLADWLLRQHGLRASQITPRQTFRHQTTHRTITFNLWHVEAVTGRLRSTTSTQWRKLDDLDDLPLANPQRRVVEILST